MAITVDASGTQTATIGVEHTLRASTAVSTFVLIVDIGAMAAIDVLELRIKTKCLSGGTLRTAYKTKVRGAPTTDNDILLSVPIPSDIDAEFTLKQTAGTGRNFPWKVLAL